MLSSLLIAFVAVSSPIVCIGVDTDSVADGLGGFKTNNITLIVVNQIFNPSIFFHPTASSTPVKIEVNCFGCISRPVSHTTLKNGGNLMPVAVNDPFLSLDYTCCIIQ